MFCQCGKKHTQTHTSTREKKDVLRSKETGLKLC